MFQRPKKAFTSKTNRRQTSHARIPHIFRIHPVRPSVAKTDRPNRIAPWPWAGQRRTSPGMLLRVVGCSRYTTQLLSQPHTALLTQTSTHAVHLVWSRARVRDNSFTRGGRGPLHRRRSRVEGKTNAFYNSPALFPTTPMPLPTILPPRVHRRSYFRWTPRFDAVPELAPAWKRHPRLASEMHSVPRLTG